MSRTVLSSEGPLAAAITRVSSCTVPACCSAFMCSIEKGPCIQQPLVQSLHGQQALHFQARLKRWHDILEDWKHAAGQFSALFPSLALRL